MDWLNTALSAQAVADFENLLETSGGAAFLALFGLEMLRLGLKRQLRLTILGDSLASFLSLGFFVALTYGLIAAAYVSIFYWVYLNFAVAQIPVTPLSVLALIVLCDFAYYGEHRFSHRVGMAWATHSVHHSSPNFNISVAYRFGPMDGVWPLIFHLPLALAGFDPIVIFACEAFVQLYQTVLHTELIGKLARPVEAVFNTPSHHRVHHGANREYIDKNYGGIFIVWDRLFGTFAEEQEAVSYGLTQPINSNNPLTVWFHGFARLMRRALASKSYADAVYAWVAPPEWNPGQPRGTPRGWLIPVTMLTLVVLWIGSTPGMAGETNVEAAQNTEVAIAATDGDLEGRIRKTAEAYYAHYVADEMDAAYGLFSDDALLHYRMDFGRYYGTSEFSFRADDVGAFDDSVLEGYEALSAEFAIASIQATAAGGAVDVVLVETYRWDGYAGTMKAKERLQIELRDESPVITRLDSEQVYR